MKLSRCFRLSVQFSSLLQFNGFDVEHGDDYGDGDSAADDVDHY